MSYSHPTPGLTRPNAFPPLRLTRDTLVAEEDMTGTVREYLYAGGEAPTAMRARQADGSYSNYFFVTNTHGDVVALADRDGNVVNRYAYGPWGEATRVSEQVHQPFRYAGYRYEDGFDLYYLRARWYDAGKGRFLSRDEFRGFKNYSPSLNRYTYGFADVTSLVDPQGLSPRRPRASQTQRDSEPIASRCQQVHDPEPWKLLYGLACPPPGFASQFYNPIYAPTQAGYRMLDPFGDCSSPFGSSGSFFDFLNACKTHDYGYDLARFGELSGTRDKDEVDDIFLWDMLADCEDRPGQGKKQVQGSGGGPNDKLDCRIQATNYYAAVRAYGNTIGAIVGTPFD